MKRRVVFGASLFLAGWVFHALFAYFWTTAAPAPEWLLLAAMAVGARGKGNTAQTLGFFWGLLLDVQTGSLFGAQGWILAAAGFAAGKFSRQVDADKLSAQLLLALGGTAFHLAVLAQIEFFFRRSGAPHVPGLGTAFLQVLINAAAAPAAFQAVRLWDGWLPATEGDHVFRS